MRVLSAPFSTRATPVGSSASANDLLWVTATTAPSQPRNAFVSASRSSRVEVIGRLVEEEHVHWSEHERGEGDARFLAAAEMSDATFLRGGSR